MLSVVFNENGGTDVNDLMVQYNTALSLPQTTRTGYKFVGWYTDVNGGTLIQNGYVVTSNMQLYAHWEQIAIVITFDSQGGTTVDSMTVTPGLTVEIRAVSTRENYTFDGWFDAPKDGNKVTQLVAMQNITLYAHWTKVLKNFKVTYEDGVGGRAFTTKSFTVVEGDPTPSFGANPTYEGYTFAGWSPALAKKVTQDVVYKATWKRDNGSGGSSGGSTDETDPSNTDTTDVENEGKSDSSADKVKTGDVNIPLIFGGAGVALAVLIGLFVWQRKRVLAENASAGAGSDNIESNELDKDSE